MRKAGLLLIFLAFMLLMVMLDLIFYSGPSDETDNKKADHDSHSVWDLVPKENRPENMKKIPEDNDRNGCRPEGYSGEAQRKTAKTREKSRELAGSGASCRSQARQDAIGPSRI